MKNLIIILFLIFSYSSYSQDLNGIYFVTKIITTEQGDKILFIKNDTINGIIMMDNDDLKVDSSFLKVKINKCYYFELEADLQKYRGEGNDGGIVISSKNKFKKIWDVKKNGPVPYIFSAKNLKGLYVKNNR